VSWDEVALITRKKGHVPCRSDEGFSLMRDDGAGDEVVRQEAALLADAEVGSQCGCTRRLSPLSAKDATRVS